MPDISKKLKKLTLCKNIIYMIYFVRNPKSDRINYCLHINGANMQEI